MRTGVGAAAAEPRRSKTSRMALLAGVAGAIGSAIIAGAGLWLPPSPPVALIGTAAMVPVFWGLLQVLSRRGRHLTWACGGLVLVDTLFLLFISAGAAFHGAFAISGVVSLTVMAMMLVLHLQRRARMQAVLVLLALLAALAGLGGLAITLKGLWLLSLGMWLMQKAQEQKDDPITSGEAVHR